ncbi:MAG: hypothetical protein ACRD1C_03710 [Terriglobales bacterium]
MDFRGAGKTRQARLAKAPANLKRRTFGTLQQAEAAGFAPNPAAVAGLIGWLPESRRGGSDNWHRRSCCPTPRWCMGARGPSPGMCWRKLTRRFRAWSVTRPGMKQVDLPMGCWSLGQQASWWGAGADASGLRFDSVGAGLPVEGRLVHGMANVAGVGGEAHAQPEAGSGGAQAREHVADGKFAWADHGDGHSLADQMSAATNLGFTSASNDRIGGAMLLYSPLDRGELLICDGCRQLRDAIPTCIHVPKRPDDRAATGNRPATGCSHSPRWCTVVKMHSGAFGNDKEEGAERAREGRKHRLGARVNQLPAQSVHYARRPG